MSFKYHADAIEAKEAHYKILQIKEAQYKNVRDVAWILKFVLLGPQIKSTIVHSHKATTCFLKLNTHNMLQMQLNDQCKSSRDHEMSVVMHCP